MFATLAQVALGGAIGAGARYLVNHAFSRSIGPGFPWATLTVNVVGSFAMGVLVVVLAKRSGMTYAPFLMTGVLGGFTTFSAFSLDVSVLYERGEIVLAGAYVLASVILSVLALFLALWMMRSWLL